MSEYIVQRGSLVNVADEIRVLSGTTEELGLDEMKTCVSEANDVIDAQATTISEIAALLEGKSVSGGDGNGGVETCSVRLHSNAEAVGYWYACPVLKSDGTVDVETTLINGYDGKTSFDITIENVVCGSMLAVEFYCSYGLNGVDTEGAVWCGTDPRSYDVLFCVITAAAGETATIYIEGDD